MSSAVNVKMEKERESESVGDLLCGAEETRVDNGATTGLIALRM